ncbi:MAG: BatA domain-containing protein [Verrucomicrobiales bacterium]|nr:BatA domain-containing protein [Verrucomicrobiales bacterium]
MASLNSFALWGTLGLIGVAVPIIIHLLYRKNRKETQWAAMELLRKALVMRSGQIKIEDFLVLALRCLAMLLIAAALLRPILNSGASKWLGEKHVGMVVAIDASLSMGHGEHSRFEKAIAKAEQVLDTAREGDPVTVVLLSQNPEYIVRAADYEPEKIKNLLSSKTTKPSPYPLALDSNVTLLAELADELESGTREVYLITDAQEEDWGTLSGTSQENLKKMTNESEFFVLPVSTDGEGEENLSISSLNYASGPLQSSGVARFEAIVENHGREVANGASIEFWVEGKRTRKQEVGQINPGDSRVIPYFVNFNNPGDLSLEAKLMSNGDDLDADNGRFAVVNIKETVRVLCVNGNSSGEIGRNVRSAVYYAVRALRLKSSTEEAAVEVTQINAIDLPQEERLDDFDIVVLANHANPDPSTVGRLHGFAERGGGLILFAGTNFIAGADEDADPNETFMIGEGDDRHSLLPAILKDAKTAENQSGWSIKTPDSDHPLAAIVKRLPEEIVNSARINRIMDCEPAPESQVILRIAENNAPLLLARDFGAGSVLMFTTSADRSWNALAVHPLYAMLLQQAATTMSSQPGSRLTACGEEMVHRIQSDAKRLELVRPDGTTDTIRPDQIGETLNIELTAGVPGIYQYNNDNGSRLTAVAANIDASESNIRVIASNSLESELDDMGLTVIDPGSSASDEIKKARRGSDLSSLLLTLAILCFLIQSVIAKIFTKKISRGETDVAASLQLSQVAAARRT